MAGQKRKMGIKAIKKAISGSILDLESTWFKIVSEADNDYLLRRSDELLREIIVSQDYGIKLEQIITLLGLVKARYYDSQSTLAEDEFNAS